MDILEENENATVVVVLDATKVERGLYLAFEIMEKGYPLVIAINMWDDAEKQNIKIDAQGIEKVLGIPVVPTVAISGEGISELAGRISEASAVDVEELTQRIEEL